MARTENKKDKKKKSVKEKKTAKLTAREIAIKDGRAGVRTKLAGGGMAMKKKKGYAKGGAAMKKKKGYARGGAVRRK